MNWYSIGLGAASGAAAALIGVMLFGKKPERKTAYALVVAGLFVLFNQLSREFILPGLTSEMNKAAIEEGLQSIPAYAAIRDKEPETYAALVATLEKGYSQGLTKDQSIQQVRMQLAQLVSRRMAWASDSALMNYVRVMVDEMVVAQRYGQDACYNMLFPQGGGAFDATKIFPPDLQTRDLAALGGIIQSYDPTRPIPGEEEVAVQLEQVFIGLYETHGDDTLVIESPGAPGIDRDKVCTISLDLYERILDLDDAESVPLLRWMMAQ